MSHMTKCLESMLCMYHCRSQHLCLMEGLVAFFVHFVFISLTLRKQVTQFIICFPGTILQHQQIQRILFVRIRYCCLKIINFENFGYVKFSNYTLKKINP